MITPVGLKLSLAPFRATVKDDSRRWEARWLWSIRAEPGPAENARAIRILRASAGPRGRGARAEFRAFTCALQRKTVCPSLRGGRSPYAARKRVLPAGRGYPRPKRARSPS